MASKAIGFLNFKFSADLTSFERAMNKAQKKLKKFGKNVTKAGQNLSRNLTLPIVGLGIASVKAFDEQAKAIAQVEAGLKSTGGTVGFTAKELDKMASAMQKVTTFGDDEILKNVTAQLLTFTNITGEQFERTQKFALDLATRLDGDLKAASIMLGKALNDPVANLSALSRAGIQFSKEQKTLVKSLVESGNVAQAQTLILKELEKQYGGSAEAAAKAGMGPIKQLQNDIGDLSEQIGERLIPFIQSFVSWIKKLAEKFDGLSEATKDNIVKYGLILAAIGPVLIIVGKLSLGLAALAGAFKAVGVFLLTSPWIAATAAIAGVGYAIYDTFIATNELATAQDDLNSISKTAESSIMDEKVAVDLLTKELTAQGISLEDKKIALENLKKISPEYYGSLEIAKGKVEGLDQATKDYTASILKQAKVEAMRKKLIDLNIELLEVEERIVKGRGLGLGIGKLIVMEGEMMKKNIQDRIDALTEEYAAINKNGKARGFWSKFQETVVGKLGRVGTGGTGGKEETGGGPENKEVENIVKYSQAMDPLVESMKEYADISTKLWQDGGLLEGPELMLNWTEKLTKAQEAHNATIQLMSDIMFSAAMSAANSQEDFFKSFIENIKKAVKQLLIQLAVMTVINLILGGPTMTIAKAFTGAKASVLGLQGFEKGGLVYGPTTALIGEGVGTTASNPEVVAPLDKLKSMIGGGNQNIIVEGVLRGNDIFLSNRNTSINRLRTT